MKINKIIIGIGNIEKKFLYTRHSIGILILKKILNNFDLNMKYNKNFNGYYNFLKKYNNNIFFYIPNTFINNCGLNIFNLINKLNLKLKDIFIVHDDLDLLFGVVKYKFNGNFNGHNGIKNLIFNINSNKFYRIRFGIGRPKKNNKKNIINYVLSNFNIDEKKKIKNIFKKIIFSIKLILRYKNINISINYLNSKKL